MKSAYLLLAMLLFIPAQADAATWIGTLYEYREDSLISEAELQTALSYLYELDIIQHMQTVYYSVGPVLEDDSIQMAALEDALDAWEDANPGLLFIERNNADIAIKWIHYLADTHVGPATCYDGLHINCTLDIALGDYDCTKSSSKAMSAP